MAGVLVTSSLNMLPWLTFCALHNLRTLSFLFASGIYLFYICIHLCSACDSQYVCKFVSGLFGLWSSPQDLHIEDCFLLQLALGRCQSILNNYFKSFRRDRDRSVCLQQICEHRLSTCSCDWRSVLFIYTPKHMCVDDSNARSPRLGTCSCGYSSGDIKFENVAVADVLCVA